MALTLSHDQILLSPHITEKSVRASARDGERVYTFKVHAGANKQEVGKAIRAVYNVHPVRVAIINMPGKSVNRRRGKGLKAGYKKAQVYLKKGETIQFV